MTCPLTERELEFVRLIADGMSGKQIASAMGVAENTVHNSLRISRLKAGVPNTTALVAKAIREEWIS